MDCKAAEYEPLTDAWRENAKRCYATVGIDLDNVSATAQDELCRAWAFYVDRGYDFGSAAQRVINDIYGDAPRGGRV